MSELQPSNQGIAQKQETEKQYYQHSLKDGYKGLLGAIIATATIELILWVGQIQSNPLWASEVKQVNDNIYLIFAGVGFVFALRHLAQIWQAKIQLKQFSLDEQSRSEH